ncbi:hypothetical protein FGIG_08370 [Fasciola gigantica]|uniref:Uncharacterized protein n=1 Tax=Fasciola gigantica TaxID=46835 RepID=A0A504YTE2_FASGI|nr:hypothetical protein FGIG_08370 [Fasciola gigantica]
MENNGSVVQYYNDHRFPRLGQFVNSCVSVSEQRVTSASGVSEPICSSIVSTPTPTPTLTLTPTPTLIATATPALPRLLSSSEASAVTVMHLANLTRSPLDTPNAQGSAGRRGNDVPQILHSCLTSLNHDVCADGCKGNYEFYSGPSVAVSSGTGDGPTVLEVLNDDLLGGEDRIELCVSSDDESDEKLSENNESTETDSVLNRDSEKQVDSNEMSVLGKWSKGEGEGGGGGGRGWKGDYEFYSGPSVAVSSGTGDGPTVLEVLNDDLLGGEDRIELCVSSDDESDEKLSENNESTETDMCVNRDSEKQVDSNEMSVLGKSSLSPYELGHLTEADFRRRMGIYDLKVEVLKLKRAYWIQKLRSL